MKFIDYVSVKRLYHELDYWIHIGIGNDIFRCPDQRPEYKYIVDKVKSREMYSEYSDKQKQQIAICFILKELTRPWFLRPTFYLLLYLWIKK